MKGGASDVLRDDDFDEDVLLSLVEPNPFHDEPEPHAHGYANGNAKVDFVIAPRRELAPGADAADVWPKPPHADAYYGLAGDVVRAIEPHSEADPIALLVPTLVMFGSVVGRGPHVRVEADEHPGRINAALVGPSAHGRKGTGQSNIERLFAQVDESFGARIESGLSSGEGLIARVADRADGDADKAVTPVDKRLLIVESELAGAFKVMERQGNTLSPVIRNAWDGRPLSTLTKNSPLRATGTHISILGHITTDEVRRVLSATEAANGFGNRFLWVCVRRSKYLPNGGRAEQLVLNELASRIARAADSARRAGIVSRTPIAAEMWESVYPDLSSDRGGLSGVLTSRAEAQVTRLGLLYALLDESAAIDEPHLRAALALWDYSARSVVHVFGDSTGNPDAVSIARALQAAIPHGLTRTEISSLFGRNIPAGRLDAALLLLFERRRAHSIKEATGGRSSEHWHHGEQP